MKHNDEAYILSQIALGNHDAFHRIFLEYYPKIKLFIANIIKSESIAEELSQDVFLKIWSSREHLPNLRSFDAYLFRMSKNAALNHLEHRYLKNSYEANYKQSSTTSTPEEELNAKELELLVQLALEKMPEQRRKIYIMSKVEDKEVMKIAEDLGLTKKTVYNQLSLALKDIRSVIMVLLLCLLVGS